MKQSIKDLLDFKIYTLDDQKATIKDFLFDSQTWTIQYVEADFGGLFSSDRILIPRVFFKNSRFENEQLFIEITKSLVDNCPRPEQHLPISRKYEEEVNKHYNIENYWSTNTVSDLGFAYTGSNPNMYERRNETEIDETNLGTTLRSVKETMDYRILSTDGNLGEISDFVIHDDSWRISYLLVDTQKWLPWSKKVLLDADMVTNISYKNKEIHLDIHSDAIKDAPEYDSSSSLNDQPETNFYRIYEKSTHQ